MKFEEMSSELQEKVKACKTAEELTELAKIEGIDLSEEMLEAVSGGRCTMYCPEHGDFTEIPLVC